MPAYDYRCPECGFGDEVRHGMNESPTYQCPDCQSQMKRVYGRVNVNHGRSRIKGMVRDKVSQEAEMKQDLLENYGVSEISPLRRTTVTDVYNDVKAQGSLVKDQMQESREIADAKRDAKQKKWKEEAYKRAPKRSKQIAERRRAEATEKRAIRI